MLEAVVELGQLYFHVVLDVFLLVADNLVNLILELLLALQLQLLEFLKHRAHQRRQHPHMLRRHLLPLPNVFLDVPELLFEVLEALQRFRDFLLLALELVEAPVAHAEQFEGVY